MKYVYSLLLAGFLCPLFSSAQSNYKPGYVVNLKGDTLKGSIDYREWDKNPQSINFKSVAGQVEKYSAKNTTAFGVTGQEYYQSFLVSISKNQVGLLNAQAVADTGVIVDKVYLRTLTTGPHVTLYNYSDAIKTRFYVADGNETPLELVYKTEYKSGEESPVQYNNRFRIQLQNIAQKYNVTSSWSDQLIVNASYNKSDLIKIAQLINNNTSQVSAKNLGGTRFFVGAGANYNRLKYYENKFTSSTFPEIAVGMDYFLNKNTQSVFFRLAISFTADKFTGNTSTPTNSPNITKYSSSVIKQSIVALTPQLVYNFYNAESLKAFISLGIALHYSPSNTYTITDTYTNNINGVTVNDNATGLHKFWSTLPTVKAGVSINKKIEIFAGYLAPSEISDYSFSQKVTAYQAGLNYYFGKN
jgi:hypothetical protein